MQRHHIFSFNKRADSNSTAYFKMAATKPTKPTSIMRLGLGRSIRDGDDPSCSICWNEIRKFSYTFVHSICGHSFHRLCYLKWRIRQIESAKDTKCPLCQQKIEQHVEPPVGSEKLHIRHQTQRRAPKPQFWSNLRKLSTRALKVLFWLFVIFLEGLRVKNALGWSELVNFVIFCLLLVMMKIVGRASANSSVSFQALPPELPVLMAVTLALLIITFIMALRHYPHPWAVMRLGADYTSADKVRAKQEWLRRVSWGLLY